MIKLIVSGRVGSDAELKTVGDTTVCSFSIAHTEKVYGPNPSEKVVWITCSIWGERGVKLAPHIVKGTFVVVEGSGGVNAYMKNGEAAAVIRCMVNSLEFGGKPTAAGIPTAIIESNKGYTNPLNNPAVKELQTELNLGGVTFEGVDGDLPF
jgi:single-strand DNA-binding protein